jgi:hypothetical protein
MIDRKQQTRSAKPRSPDQREQDATMDEARLRQQAIGVGLRHMFDEVVSEPVPDEFLEILRAGDARQKESGE